MSGRRGLVVPQNTFLENIIKRANGVHQHFLLGSAQILDAPIVYCSDGFIKMTGYKKNHVIRKKTNCSFMYGSLTTKDSVRELRNALQEKTSAQIEILLYKKDGTPFWVLLNIGLINDEWNETALFLLTFQDISEFKEPINPNYRKHRWTEFNRSLHSKPAPDNPISKAKEEKNRMNIAQLMETRIDHLPDYKQDIPKTPRFVILHCSTAKIVWDWFILIFILYTATSVPFIVCFKFDSVPMTIADTAVDFMFLIDIVLNFHTSYVDDDGSIVFDPQRIRRTYFRSWFFVDLVTSLPYGLLALFIVGAARGITDIISFLKAIRLLRLNRVVRALDQYLEYGFITLILWMLFFCLCAHWMACIFYAIADNYDKFADIGWVRAMSDATNQPLLYVNGTLMDAPTLASLYMSSLYFSLTSLTSIGFGNIAPNTTAEKIFSCVTMIFGGLCYAVIFGQVTAIVQQSQKKSESYHHTLDNMRSFCKLHKVPKEISTRILDYYIYTWALNKGVDTNQVLQHCPKDLQSDICIHLNRKVIDSTPAFGELSNAVLRAIARNFAIHRVAPGERVVHEGETLDVLYFVATGSFEITQKGKVVGLVGEGDVFGDDVCRNTDIGRSVADVFALTYGDVHIIGRDELLSALSFYPEYGYQFAKVFRLSYNLRDEITMRKFSSLPRVKPHGVQKEVETAENRKGRRLSFVEEMQNNFETDSSFDLGTPNSQSMTDTDPPSKSFTLVRSSKPRLQANTMKAISEDGELDDSGADEDLKHWSEYQNRRESTDGLLNEITEMKSEVRHEIEVMGSKMNHLEENISAILSLLKERDTPTSVPGDGYRSRNGLPPNLNVPRTAPGSARSRTASIISRVKAEIPEETLPPWIEKEHLEMTEDISTSEDVMTTPEKHDTPEKPRKTRSQKSKRKKREKSENETKQTTENISHQHDLKEEKEHSAPTAEETSGKISSLSQHETQEENLPLTSMNEATNEELLLQVGNETEVADEPVTSAIKETSEKISWQSQQESDDDGEVVASNSEAAGGKVSRANACDIQHFDEQEGLGSEETEMKQLTV